jgi:hypothetical protein
MSVFERPFLYRIWDCLEPTIVKSEHTDHRTWYTATMATLQQIYVNIGTGMVIAFVSFGLFGLAIERGYTNEVAPRSWARPKSILKNVLKRPFAFSWISWSLRQSYPDLLDGVPGTGTRNDGWTGPMLKVNLDGIIMIKYHVLLLKVAVLTTILCTVVLLPLNLTAECDPQTFGQGSCQTVNNLTDFERTTISHIPPLSYNATGSSAPNDAGDDDAFGNDEDRVRERDVSLRYAAIALVCWVIYWYICRT